MKLSSQGTKFYIGTPGAPGAPVTAITKAAPPLLTWAAIPAGLADGDLVLPQGFGWRSIDNRPFKLANVGDVANTAELAGADTSGELAAASLGTLSEVTFGESCMATITLSSPAGTTIDVTTLCDAARETIDGLPGVSTWQATGFWDAQDPMQATLRALYKSQQKVPIQVIFNDGSGLLFMGSVNQFDITVGVDQAVAFTVGGNISGPITDLPIDPALMAALQAQPMGGGDT
ncbi:MAG TPA: hypothetical protein VJQ81_20070, partial [Reyranella sp.]|nr:hypothetical protein [Reyranella sp.]